MCPVCALLASNCARPAAALRDGAFGADLDARGLRIRDVSLTAQGRVDSRRKVGILRNNLETLCDCKIRSLPVYTSAKVIV